MNRTYRVFNFTVPADLGLLFLLATLTFLLHAVVNAFGGYGIFRDELYYLACANHLDTGYVDQPPFSIYLLAFNRLLFGDSVFAIRLLPALLGAATVLYAGLVTREMGGGIRAQFFAAAATACMPILLGMNSIYSMNSIDIFCWTLGAYFVVQLVNKEEPHTWLILGFIIGIGLLNKISMGWFAAGLALAIIITNHWRSLKTPWPYVAAFIALLLFVPYILWNIQHDFAHLVFMRNAVQYKYTSVTVWSFLAGQLLLPGPAALPLWVLGLAFFFFHPQGKRYVMLGIIFAATVAILVINGHSKPEYLFVAYPMVFAGGGIFFEKIIHARGLTYTYAFILIAEAIVVLPVVVPILPVETFVRYQNFVGIRPPSTEAHTLTELSQFYADMFGWEDKARVVARVYHAMSPEDQAKCVFFGDNYGRSGAIDYYRAKYGLPPAIGCHNSYWIWGPGKSDGDLVLILGGRLEDKKQLFESVDVVDSVYTKYAIPYENNLRVYVCRKVKVPLSELWKGIRVYD